MVFTKVSKSMFICTDIDDLLIASASEQTNKAFLTNLAIHFDLKVTGELTVFSGLSIWRDRTIKILQIGLKDYAQELLKFVDLDNANGVTTPITPNIMPKLVKEDEVHEK